MSKNKRAGASHALKWLDKPPTHYMVRDVEDATAAYYLAHGLNARAPKRNDVKFLDLLPHLKSLDKRWAGLTSEVAAANKRACLKSLVQAFCRLKGNPSRLSQMIDDQRTVSEPSHDAGISGDYGAEDDGAAHGSGEDEREGDPEDGADDGAGDGPEDGGSKSAGSSSSLAAPELVHAPEQPARQLLGKRARATDWTEADSAQWINFGKVVKRLKMAQEDLTVNFQELRILCKGLPVDPTLVDPDNMVEMPAAA